jgi:hypothetical protein
MSKKEHTKALMPAINSMLISAWGTKLRKATVIPEISRATKKEIHRGDSSIGDNF